ncbi:MAG TPA: alpha-L-fucosidase [Candidatus Hydrogenedentes bacterium]|nr:alpha-L-fucosidase [Candidatus Hydrogenedentota bacterium]
MSDRRLGVLVHGAGWRSGALCAALGMLCAGDARAQDDAARRAEALAAIDRGAAAGPFQPAWDSLETYTVPDWYLDAKFGIFIHWGVYSVPAFGSEWYPRNMYREKSPEFRHHVETHGPQKTFGYKDFIPGLTAANYDPAAWAELFRRAGAKYIVPVAEHHDGFPMYDCSYSDWTAAKMGPKRDLIGELADAVRKEGLIFGLSSHRAEHWWFFDGGRKFDSDVNDPAFAGLYAPAQPEKESTPDAAFLDDWLLRTCELVDKYQPQLVWFDWWIEQPCFQPYLQRFAAYYYNQGAAGNRGVAINYKNKSFPIKAAVWDIERGQLAEIRQPFWQTDTSVSLNSWGYVEKQRYKTVTSLVQDLVDIVSKNGALLLNIGPRPDGTIPEPEREMLLDIGKWLEVNGEAVYGTRPWKVYGEGPTKVADGSFTDAKKKAFTAEDIRFTTKDGALYAVLLAWPEKRVAHIDSLSLSDGNVAEVTLLGAPKPLKFMQNDKELRVNLPKEKPCDHAYTLKITFQAK